MENCCYGRSEMMVLNMVRQGLFGEILHGECGYLHDLRGVKFSTNGEGLWRRDHSMTRNGNLYPTHGLGPVAQCMNINRGDRFDYLVSMSSPSRGLQLWQQEHLPPDDPRRSEKYVLGDVNVCLIKTVKGRTIYLVHDTNLPRAVQPHQHGARDARPFLRLPRPTPHRGPQPRPPLGRGQGLLRRIRAPLVEEIARGCPRRRHGGMDFIEDYRLIQCLRAGTPMDMDVYDAAAWSVICELTERSVANRSRPIDFPDFTRGRWQTNPPLGTVGSA